MAIPKVMNGLANALGLGTQNEMQAYDIELQQRRAQYDLERAKYEYLQNQYLNGAGGGGVAGQWTTVTSTANIAINQGYSTQKPSRPSPSQIAAQANNDPAMTMPIEQCLLLLKARFEGWYSLHMIHDGDDAKTLVTFHRRCMGAGLLEIADYEGHELYRPKEL